VRALQKSLHEPKSSQIIKILWSRALACKIQPPLLKKKGATGESALRHRPGNINNWEGPSEGLSGLTAWQIRRACLLPVIGGQAAQFGFDLQQAVVLGDALAAAGGAGLELAPVHGHCEVRQEIILGLP
jgi:hypothetical protein